MELWKKRLISEEKELAWKIRRLRSFLNCDTGKGTAEISGEELIMMIDQLHFMENYDAVLRARMEMHHLILEVKNDGKT